MAFLSPVFRPFNSFDSFWTQIPADDGAIRASQAYICQCGRPIFFRNSFCVNCGASLGYETTSARLQTLVPVADPAAQPEQMVSTDLWTLWHDPEGAQYRRCANLQAIGCNWLLPGDAAPGSVCLACSLNRTVPDLSIADNVSAWRALEIAKRHLVAQLLVMGLPVASKITQDPERGMAFDFLRPLPDKPVLTGHDEGIITLNIQEANDAHRELVRSTMHEPYRTLLGHMRHEIGHYYWDRLVDNTPWLEDYRALFGDERADYAEALKRNYAEGPPQDWPQRFVSTYASSHPWEDWAETWAHYLHMVDTLGTAMRFGLNAKDVELPYAPFDSQALWKPDDPGAETFLKIINAWVELTCVLNEMSRSMGESDFYPFVLPKPVVAKLQFIHCLVLQARQVPDLPLTPQQAAEPEPPAVDATQSQTQSQTPADAVADVADVADEKSAASV
ncbi:putative zinc-binding metallopeptidase [Rhodoferax sp.]|uniref:zinc-binding metallopeptidase family protein n=1 Tax=Rhodoferax sp. TaxID=50421 RepID=UPI00374C9FBE